MAAGYAIGGALTITAIEVLELTQGFFAAVSALTEVFFADAAVTSVLPFMLANWGQFERVWPWTRWPVNATAPAERYAEWVSLKAIFCM